MARRKDLTALAALGTLGYMMSKRGDKKDDKKTEGPAIENLPVARPSMKPDPIFAAGEAQGKEQPSGDASLAEKYASRPRNPEAEQEADNPRKTAPKPNASKPSSGAAKAAPKLIDPSNIRSGPRFDEEGLIDPSNIRSGRREFEESQLAPKDKTKMSVTERLKSKFGMKSGGMVSSASKRADGIATKGKTRGKIC